eukprot:m.849339 g.849339  ORF g.849339 m.849339 type:complete len:109 (-) comp59573_c0_seq2:980-1306(-)
MLGNDMRTIPTTAGAQMRTDAHGCTSRRPKTGRSSHAIAKATAGARKAVDTAERAGCTTALHVCFPTRALQCSLARLTHQGGKRKQIKNTTGSSMSCPLSAHKHRVLA